MGIDRIEHFMGGDAILSTRSAYASLEALDVTRPEVDNIIKLYLQRNVYYDATVTRVRLLVRPEGHARLQDVDGRAELPRRRTRARSPTRGCRGSRTSSSSASTR